MEATGETKIFLPIQNADGTYISNPGWLFLAAASETSVEKILGLYQLALNGIGDADLRRRNKQISREFTAKGHAAHVLLEM